MIKQYKIIIRGFDNPDDFVKKWSKFYSYSIENKYNNNISCVFDNYNSFLELFRWKNGTGDVISHNKMKVINGFYDKVSVLRSLQRDFSWELFEQEFEPTKSSTIWKIFLLHLICPIKFPIYDQHVHRFYSFLKNGIIEEIPTKRDLIYSNYKEYKNWFNYIQSKFKFEYRNMDMSFFIFGKFLKQIKGLPVEISENFETLSK